MTPLSPCREDPVQVRDFTYHRPTTLVQACELGRTLGSAARYLAGGTELLVDFRNGRDSAEHLISLQDIPELRAIRRDRDGLRIGGLATLAEVADAPEVRRFFLPLSEAIQTMAGVQIRNQGTIGGNFCRAVPCADTPPICIAAEAQLCLAGPKGDRTIPAETFFTGPRQTAIQPGEILAEILIPTQPKTSGASYQRFSLRTGSSLAVAAVAARITLEGRRIADARIVLGAVAPIPLLAKRCAEELTGNTPSDERFRQAARIAAAEAKPITDLRGSAEFRRELVEVLTVRALTAATARAGGGGAARGRKAARGASGSRPASKPTPRRGGRPK